MQCPSCAAPIEADQRFGHFHVCPFCQAASILDGEAAKLAGRMAVLADPEGPLAVDAAGTLEGRGFRVVGRVRHGHRTGFWDEWYLSFDDGETAWVSEDEGDLWLEEPHGADALDEDVRSLEKQTPGDEVMVAGRSYRLTEKGIAKVEGGEGQLPEPLDPHARFRYYDLRAPEGGGTATVEIDLAGKALEPDSARVFTGRSIGRDALRIEVPGRRNTLEAERAAGGRDGGDDRRRVVKKSGRSLRIGCDSCGADLGVPAPHSSALTCDSCGTTLDLGVERRECGACGLAVPLFGGGQAGMVSCRGCGAQLDATDGGSEKLRVLRVLDETSKRARPPIPLGKVGHLEGTEWRVVGHLKLVQREGGIRYPSDEQLLWSEDEGYAWLVHEYGHFSLARELAEPPTTKFATKPRKTKFRHQGREWRVFERGTLEVESVDGELSWVAEVGDKVRYCDATSPPYLLSEERTLDESGNVVEAEWSTSLYLEREQVAKAFGVRLQDLPRKKGVAAHQPYRQNRFFRESGFVMAGLAVVQLVLVLWALAHRGEQLATFRIGGEEYTAGWLSPEFEIRDANGVLGVSGYSQVDNSWVFLGVALVEAESQGAVQDLELQISYYHGYEGGESWSEGSQEDTAPFRAPGPGRYHLLVQGNAGRGESGTSSPGASPSVALTVHQGWVLVRFFLLGLLACLLWTAFAFLPRMIFEGQRWKDDD